MDDVTRPVELPLLSDHLRFARRHRVAIAGLGVLGLTAGVVWAMLQPHTHSATASVALLPVPVYVVPSADDLVPPEVSIDTDAQLLGSPQVQEAVADALGTEPDDSGAQLSYTASPNTRVLHVTVTAPHGSDPASAANAAVEALRTVRRLSLGSLQRSQLQQLRLLALEQERLLAREQGRRLVVPARDELFARAQHSRSTLAELETARSDAAEVLRPARPPVGADYANNEVPVTSGAMLGLLAGCLYGGARDRTRRLPHHTEEHDHA